MKPHTEKSFSQSLILLFCLLVLPALACSTLMPADEPASQIPSEPTSAEELITSPPIATELPVETTEPSTTLDQGLSPTGPWWVISTSQKLIAVNADGSGRTALYEGDANEPFLRKVALAPRGGYLAYLTVSDILDSNLHIIQLPSGSEVAEVPLTPKREESEEAITPGDPAFEAHRAITSADSMAFSPDGGALAFMGAINGPTSDLYVYQVQEDQLVQLTDGPSQAFQPSWSPDGRYIVHTGANSFGTGAGLNMAGVWAARADDSGVIDLYDPSDAAGEEVLGWASESTFLVYSWDAFCGPNNLRAFNVESRQANILWPEYFQTIAYDPIHKNVVLSHNFEGCGENSTGLYWVPTDGGNSLPIVEDTANRMTWDKEAGLVLALTGDGALAVDQLGQFIDLDMPDGALNFPEVSPADRALAWTGGGLWIGPLLGSIEEPPQQIFDQAVDAATWNPSGDAVLFIAGGSLYVARSPEFRAVEVSDGIEGDFEFAEWLQP